MPIVGSNTTRLDNRNRYAKARYEMTPTATEEHTPSSGCTDTPTGVGVAFTPFETRTELIMRLASQAEALGLDRVDVAEGWTHDAIVLLAELAGRTSRIGLGTCVISAWGRTPATIALSAAGLQRCSGGRFSLGVGAGSPPLTEGFHGTQWDRPLTRLRDTLTAVRALLNGDRLRNPAPGARPLRLGVVPAAPVPIVLAALSDGSIRLAGELADGWAPFLWARSRVEDGRALLREGEARSEAPNRTRVSPGIPVALGPDEASARALAAWWLSTYITRMGPLYPRMLSQRLGMTRGVNALIDAARDSDSPKLPAAAEDLAHEVTLMETYDRAEQAISAWFEAGADTVHLVLPPNRPDDELAQILAAVAGFASRAALTSDRAFTRERIEIREAT
jgi:alkanesulfonate monooxygenase SsuD/methylene tetrahydromethanopterin reductase-like flavin-dependent oxidoreductase (luciferase family)